MKYSLLIGAFLGLASSTATAQRTKLDATQTEIMQEGMALYASERSSWVATDVLRASKQDISRLGGYLSYIDGDSVRTIFFSRADSAPIMVLYGFQFARTTIEPNAGRASGSRPLSAREQQLVTLRQAVYTELRSGNVLKMPYRFPVNTSPNVVVLDQDGPRAYVLVGPKEDRILPIGNDFRFTFTADGSVKQVERLHNTYLAMRLPEDGKQIQGSVHTHLEAHPFITPTDICSLLLYKDIYKTPQHYVIGKQYVSLFDLSKQQLFIMTRKAFDRIEQNQSASADSPK